MPKFRTSSFELSLIKSIELSAAAIPGVISLAQGIPSFSLTDGLREYLKKALDNKNIGRYSLTNGLPGLRETISLYLENKGIHADPDKEILVTAGATEAIASVLLTILNPGEEVILFGPCYASYISAVRTAHGAIKWVELNANANWKLDVEALKKAINKKTKAVLFANPNNPTGTVLDKKTLLSMAKILSGKGIYLIVDEVYRDFIYSGDVYFSLLSEPKYRDFVVSIYSLSKSYSLTGFRIGYMVAPEALLREVLKVHDAIVNCAPVISQYAALYALENGENIPVEFKNEFNVRKKIVTDWLNRHSRHFSYREPDAAYFVFPKLLEESDSKKFAADILKKAKVAIVPGVAFGPYGEGHVRLSFGAEKHKIIEALDRISEVLK